MTLVVKNFSDGSIIECKSIIDAANLMLEMENDASSDPQAFDYVDGKLLPLTFSDLEKLRMLLK